MLVSEVDVLNAPPVDIVKFDAVALPMFGVVNDGDEAKTTAPDPVTPLLKSDAANWLTVTTAQQMIGEELDSPRL